MPDLLVQIIMALVFVTIGFIGGALAALAWSGRQKSSEESAADSDKAPEDLLEVARLYLPRTGEGLAVEVESKMYRTPESIEPRLRDRLSSFGKEWIKWMGVDLRIQPVDATGQSTASDALPSVSTASRGSVIAPVVLAKKEVKNKPPASIVAQIDEVLQTMLQDSPLLEHGIRLTEDLHHGVVVWVGVTHYDGIESVPDEDVKKFIRSAVAEWERREEEEKIPGT
jgi:hypothetical protein